ncbi:MAG: hypothetical protein NWE93_00715 [Candidatus Bathyarchaeota archaeon]|nr:hypothetical protein [Candidatus Bathyarchaeota archaeon]
MVKAIIKLAKLIQYSLAVENLRDEGDWLIFYYAPDGVTQHKIKLDADSVAALKKKRDELLAFLDQVALSGEVVATWKLEDMAVPAKTNAAWVRK